MSPNFSDKIMTDCHQNSVPNIGGQCLSYRAQGGTTRVQRRCGMHSETADDSGRKANIAAMAHGPPAVVRGWPSSSSVVRWRRVASGNGMKAADGSGAGRPG